ncbi:hypothetical protein FT663_02365 [Candidozyma haemuli var. vulneris]|nr:hypothetical protein FT662_04857 [[Candida] haemuloni var. vulneris]KAF3992308.1 hypothetical protein FT663_02365 [[Candida] haemuloni var. vulneris]
MIHLHDRLDAGAHAPSSGDAVKSTSERRASQTSTKVKSGYESSSSSDMDGLTGDLDQIGRLSIPSWPSLKDGFPNFSGFPSLGNLPQLPSFDLPSFDLSEVSKSVSQYMNALRNRTGGGEDEEDPKILNSVKTAVATKIQMNSFLQDLRNGRSLQAAIDRLQPLSDLIHEVITLPVDGDEEMEKEPETAFEPEGVGEIVNREQPLLTQLVSPDGEEIDGLLDPTHRSRRDRHRHRANRLFKRAGSAVLSDDGTQTGSDLDYMDELTPEEAKALTHLDSIDDFYKEDLLRSKIQKIQNLADLSQSSKNKLVTRLMMGNYYKYINEKLAEKKGFSLRNQAGLHLPEDKEAKQELMEEQPAPLTTDDESCDEEMEEVDDDEVVLTREDTLPSYFDEEKGVLGCSHYQRNCKLECPTCLKWYPCRFCHDQEVTDHKLQRNAVKHILCMKCNAPQVPDTAYCVNCDEELANYFCSKCVLYDNDPNKDIYHCDKCGICRLGLGIGKDYFHCDECNICLSIDLKEHHKCVTNTTHCNCPICNEYLFTSVSKVVFMKCGHSIHESCYDEMVKHSYKCPVCKKTVVNVETQFRILDQEIRQSPLPHPYNMWRCIISCNDCKGKSSCQYHVLGLKCKYCQSYNTNQLKLIKPEEESANNSAEEESDGDNDRIASMRLMQTNLSSNFIIDEQTTDNNTEYDADYNSEGEGEGSDDQEGGNTGSIVNFRRLTKSLLGKRDVDRTSITAVFQNFINHTIAEVASDNEEDQSDPDILGGF